MIGRFSDHTNVPVQILLQIFHKLPETLVNAMGGFRGWWGCGPWSLHDEQLIFTLYESNL